MAVPFEGVHDFTSLGENIARITVAYTSITTYSVCFRIHNRYFKGSVM